jgi:hypothetical protein
MPNAFKQPTGKTAGLLRRTMSADHRLGYELLREIQKRPAFKINGLRFECVVCRVRGSSTAGWLPGLDSNQNWVSQSHLCYHYTTRQWRETAYVGPIENAVKAGKTGIGAGVGTRATGNGACAG